MKQKSKDSLIILASASPRRKDLLEKAGVDFIVVPSRVQEENFAFSDPKSYAMKLAEAKADDVSRQYPDNWVIGADSIVVIDGKILEKPKTTEDAKDMLMALSGKTHHVHTGYSIICKKKPCFFSEVITTAVMFKALTVSEIHWYINTNEPYDKAGGYAIQGLASSMVKQIRGSYTNVVGLPVCEIIDNLMKQGVIKRTSNHEFKNRFVNEK